jgi:hemerythrin
LNLIIYPAQLQKHMHLIFIIRHKCIKTCPSRAYKVLTVVMNWLKDHIVQADGAYAKHAMGRSW